MFSHLTFRSITIRNNEKDVTLCIEVLLYEPLRFNARTKERDNAWKSIAENLNEMNLLYFKMNLRVVREKCGEM